MRKISQAKKEGGPVVRRSRPTRAPEVNQYGQGQAHNLWNTVHNENVGPFVQKAASAFLNDIVSVLWVHQLNQQIFIKHLLCAIDSSMHRGDSKEYNRAKSLLS